MKNILFAIFLFSLVACKSSEKFYPVLVDEVGRPTAIYNNKLYIVKTDARGGEYITVPGEGRIYRKKTK